MFTLNHVYICMSVWVYLHGSVVHTEPEEGMGITLELEVYAVVGQPVCVVGSDLQSS